MRDKIINNTIKFVKEMWLYILVLIIIILIKIFIVTPVKVNGTSMVPTLKNGDIMVLNKLAYKKAEIKRFDIVVIYLKENGKTEKLIKRVIGLPGEKIEYKNNNLYVNGNIIKENFKHTTTEDFNLELLSTNKVPDNEYFVVGDNREVSADSRIIGFIKEDEIEGRVTYTIFPFNRFGIKK